MVTIQATYQGDLHCNAIHGPSGTSLATDAPKDNQGRGESFSPTDLVATGLLTCVMSIMGIAARREGIDLLGMRGQVTKNMIADPNRRISSLDLELELPAHLDSRQRALLEKISATCPVCHSLSSSLKVNVSFSYFADIGS